MASRFRVVLPLTALIAAAAALRLYGIDWDQGRLFHPDERHILMVTSGLALPLPPDWSLLLSAKSPLNPHFFAYGSFPFYLLKGIAHLLASLAYLGTAFAAFKPFSDFDHIRLVGRALSSLFDLGTVLLAYFIGAKVWDRRVGLLGAAFVGFAVLHIQLAHFYAFDTILTFLTTASVLLALRLMPKPTLQGSLLLGLVLGLALATKISSLPILAVLAGAHGLRLFLAEKDGGRGPSAEGRGLSLRMPAMGEINRAIGLGVISVATAIVVLLVLQPYTIIDWETFTRNIAEQSGMVSGASDLPYTRQYAGTARWWYFVQDMVQWGFGWPLGLAAIAGSIVAVVRAVRRPTKAELLLLVWVVPYFAITGSFHTKFLRYVLPVTPIFALFAALALVLLYDWARRRQEARDGELETSVAESRVAEVSVLEPDFEDELGLIGDTSVASAVTVQSRGDELVVILSPSPKDEESCPRDGDSSSFGEGLRMTDGSTPNSERVSAAEDTGGEAVQNESQQDTGYREPTATAVAPLVPVARAPEVLLSFGETQHGPTESFGGRAEPAWLARARERGWLQWAATGLIGLVLGLTALYSLAYVRIYSTEHTGVQASEWMYENIPDGARISREHWEEGLPVAVRVGGVSHSPESHRYQIGSLNLYENDNQGKFNHIVERLTNSDYIIFFSNRLYATIPRLPDRYPITTEYYKLLFSEQLGFELAASFTSYPNIAGITLMDDTFSEPGITPPRSLSEYKPSPVTIMNGKADESFTVYDHPKVMIFKKVRTLPQSELQGLFAESLKAASTPKTAQVQGQPKASFKSLLLTEQQQQVAEEGGTFSEAFDRNGIENSVPWLVWMVMLQFLGIVALPIGFFAFRHLADRGYLLAKILGILLLTWLNWMLVNLTPLQNTRLSIFLALVAITLLGGWLAYRQRDDLLAFWRSHRRVVLASEVVFWTAFLVFLMVRMANPDLWHPARGGEKPMDLAYLMAAIKTAEFPPYDPWFAGGYINYYYYGQVIVATLVKLSGVLPTTAFNLAVPTLFALTVGGAFSIAYNLVAKKNESFTQSQRSSEGSWGPIACGVAAGLFLAVVGNLGGAAQIVEQFWRVGGLQSFPTSLPGVEGMARLVVGIWAAVVDHKPYTIPTDWYWASSRMYQGPAVITEFPYFTFLFADLHAHLIAFPFTLLALGFAVNVVKRESATFGIRLGWERWVTLEAVITALLGGLVLGVLWPINSWDFPTYLGIYSLALAIPWYLSERRNVASLVVLAAVLGATGALAMLLYWPFHSAFQLFYSGLDPSPEKSDIWRYLGIHALFLFALVTFLAFELRRSFGTSAPLRIPALFTRRWEVMPRAMRLYGVMVRQRSDPKATLALYIAAATLAVVVTLLLLKLTLVGILFALLVPTLALVLRRDRPAEQTFLLALLATGFALGIFTEILTIKGDVARMNTVFKFYLQVWIMWAIGAAVALYLIRDKIKAIRRKGTRRTWRGLLAFLLVCVAIYPIVATWARVHDRFSTNIPPTLDGTAYIAQANYNDQSQKIDMVADMAAIRWLQDNIKGSPVVLEASIPTYRWGSRVSIYTGLPTVLGWDWHQKQQRWGYQATIDQRSQEVKAMYSDTGVDRTVSLLQKYRVKYIYVGDLERAYYPGQGIAKFDNMVGRYLRVVYDQQRVKIYEVIG